MDIFITSVIIFINIIITVWDATKASRFSWYWQDATTLAPYLSETSYEGSLLVKGAGSGAALALSSLAHVLRSLTPNARGVFAIISKHQLKHEDDANYAGMYVCAVEICCLAITFTCSSSVKI